MVRVLFGDAQDERVRAALELVVAEGAVRPVVVGRAGSLKLPEGVELLDPDDRDWSARILEEYLRTRGLDAADEPAARAALRDTPLLYGAVYTHLGGADAALSGAVSTSADVLRAAITGLGLARPDGLVAACFLLRGASDTLTFADCVVVPDPTPAQLAEIAAMASDVHRAVTGIPARTAMLSFSTDGSARHPRVTKVTDALALVRKRRPDLVVDGEMQLDCALAPEVGARKFPGSPVAGRANVLIFPDLDSANIGYKMAERLGGRRAVGSIVMGLAKPWIDLSRGCSVRDIVESASVVAALATASSRVGRPGQDTARKVACAPAHRETARTPRHD